MFSQSFFPNRFFSLSFFAEGKKNVALTLLLLNKIVMDRFLATDARIAALEARIKVLEEKK
jgi:hypothetical protein